MVKQNLSLILIVLGLWLIATPLTYFFQPPAIWNDLITGILLIGLGIGAFFRPHFVYFYLFFLIGIYLQLAPLFFWYTNELNYLHDSMVGIIVSGLAFLFLNTPSIDKNSVPAGRSHNPSSWTLRAPILILTVACWLLARYLSAYQLGYITTIWDPFFGDGTVKILSSKISQFLPISDAGLGAFAYSLEALLVCQGKNDRWRSCPWAVLSFGFIALPVGIISILLIILQPLAMGTWCLICLSIAFLMLLIVFLSLGEVIATLQLLKQKIAQKKSLWKFLIHGDC